MAHEIRSPGISVQIIDQTSYSSIVQSGAIAATVGFAEKGPINEPVLCLTKQSYIDTFGEPLKDHYYMGVFADKFLDISPAWFTRIAKDKDFEKLIATNPPSLNFTTVPNPEFWIDISGFPAPNNGIFKVKFTGNQTYSTINDLVSSINNAINNIVLPDGESRLSNYIVVELNNDNTRLVFRSTDYYNVVIKLLPSNDNVNNVIRLTGNGALGFPPTGASSTDTGSYSYSRAIVPINLIPETKASVSSSTPITISQLNKLSAFNKMTVEVDGSPTEPFKVYQDVDLTPSTGTPATFPVLSALNSPVLNVNLSGATFTITLSGFYHFMTGNNAASVNNNFTITTTIDGSVTPFTINDLVADLNSALAGVTIGANNLKNYIQFEIYDTNKIRLTNGDGGLKNFGSQVSLTIASGTGDVANLGYVAPSQSSSGANTTWTVAGIANKINAIVDMVEATSSANVLTIRSKRGGTTSFIRLLNPTNPSLSALSEVLNIPHQTSSTGTPEANSGIVNFLSKDPGSFGNKIKVRTYTTTNQVTGDTVYNINVYLKDQLVEQYTNVNWTDKNSNRFVVKLLENSKYIRVDFGPTTQHPEPDLHLPPLTPPPNNGQGGAPEYWVLTGGSDGIPTSQEEIDSLAVQALDNYIDKERYVIDLILAPGFVGNPVVNKLINIAENRRDLLALVDPPPFLTWKQVIDWHNGNYTSGSQNSVAINSQYVVTTWDWQKDFDQFNDRYIDLPASVYEAIAIARTDKNYNFWEAPAGPVRGVVNSISSYSRPTQEQREYLYNDVDNSCINPIVQLTNEGIMIYGQKTCLRVNKAMNRINVVRTVNSIKRNVEAIGRKYIFELSNAATWASVSRELTSYLSNLQERGCLTSFSVIFDASTNTPERIDQGIMYGKIFIQPVKVTERIFIDLTITNTGAEATT